VNENKIAGILARRASTRAGSKRSSDRMYLVNNKWWHNSNGANVSNKINPANWVRSENNDVSKNISALFNNANVKTFKRK
jgi:hypothetical protein